MALTGDEGAAAGAGAQIAGSAQLAVGVDDADAADAELAGRARGWQAGAFRPAGRHASIWLRICWMSWRYSRLFALSFAA